MGEKLGSNGIKPRQMYPLTCFMGLSPHSILRAAPSSDEDSLESWMGFLLTVLTWR